MIKTPLQQWAWERYRIKGSITATRQLLKGLCDLKYIHRHESDFIAYAIKTLDGLMLRWDTHHQVTRRYAARDGALAKKKKETR